MKPVALLQLQCLVLGIFICASGGDRSLYAAGQSAAADSEALGPSPALPLVDSALPAPPSPVLPAAAAPAVPLPADVDAASTSIPAIISTPSAKPSPPAAPAPAALLPACDGILVDYRVVRLAVLPYYTTTAYEFDAEVVLSNIGSKSLESWTLSFSYSHQESITNVSGASLPTTALPPIAGNGLVLSNPSGLPYLDNALQSPSDYTHVIKLKGTEIGATNTLDALPASINFESDGYSCDPTPLEAE
eukprot:jgi/Mesen1/277/ME1152393C09525